MRVSVMVSRRWLATVLKVALRFVYTGDDRPHMACIRLELTAVVLASTTGIRVVGCDGKTLVRLDRGSPAADPTCAMSLSIAQTHAMAKALERMRGPRGGRILVEVSWEKRGVVGGTLRVVGNDVTFSATVANGADYPPYRKVIPDYSPRQSAICGYLMDPRLLARAAAAFHAFNDDHIRIQHGGDRFDAVLLTSWEPGITVVVAPQAGPLYPPEKEPTP